MSSKKKSAGDEIVDRLNGALVGDLEWDERELEVLELIRRTGDDIAVLEAVVAADGAIVAGSKGQGRVNPAIPELRLQRAALARLVGRLELPELPEEVQKSPRHQRAARARWDRRPDRG